MRIPLRLSGQSPARKLIAAATIAALASLVAVGARYAPYASIPLSRLDNVLYDSFYRLRPIEDRTAGPVVIVAVDDKSLKELSESGIGKTTYGWPWPRQFFGIIAQYLGNCGARAVAFDILFAEPSVFNHFDSDDAKLARMVDTCKAPVIFGVLLDANGRPQGFAPPVKQPIFGAVNVGDDVVFRRYVPVVHGMPSLAARAASAVGASPPASPFLLHYYGPYQTPQGKRTFRYVSASHVLAAGAGKKNVGVTPDMFRDKVVLIGAITVGTYDLKASPLSAEYPGVEVQATALENMLSGRRVRVVSAAWSAASAFLAALLAAVGVALPGRVLLKLLAAALVTGALFGVAIFLFVGRNIYWLPLAAPILALLLATIGAFAWSYLAEGRQRRVILKALSQYVSPHVAAQIDRDPSVLKLGGIRREMTVLFTDLEGFTSLSEGLDENRLTELLNYYFDEMSGLILREDGTLDKYIGDAIMSFWNAPLLQPDHAILACRAALAMSRREQELQPRLREMGAKRLLTRIGINTGPMVFGNMGSSQKFNYSVLGDSVNLASRLEGANKFYGSHILIAQSTADAINGHFLLRRLDVLRVKGKQQPMAVYELMSEGTGDGDLRLRAAEYEAAFASYQHQSWDDAESRLEGLLEKFPDDAPARALLARILELRQTPPGADWEGIYVARAK